MRTFVVRERATINSVTRGQISVAVNQLEVTGVQSDIKVNQLWDLTIINAGQQIAKTLASYPSECGTNAHLQKKGAASQVADEWLSVCQEGLLERSRFGPLYEQTISDRAALKSFQVAVEARRQALVKQSNSIQ
jgi:hypothetical protein